MQRDLRNVIPLDGGGQTVDRVPGHAFCHLVPIITAREQTKPQCKNKEKGWRLESPGAQIQGLSSHAQDP